MELTQEIRDLIKQYETGKIGYKDLYLALQKFPSDEKDKSLAEVILEK
jgi:hypothetical protein